MLVLAFPMFISIQLSVERYRLVTQPILSHFIGGFLLGLYYFGEDKKELDDILKNTTSGGVTINDVVFHVAQDNAPFGGVGPSGTGSYHGIEGFKNFSHAKTIYTQTKFDGLINIFRPPYGTKAKKALKMQIKP